MKKIFFLFLLLPFISFAQDSLADKCCKSLYLKGWSSNPVSGFEKSLLKHMGLPTNTPDKEKHISKFFNENNHLLICEDDEDESIRPNEHILKRSIAIGRYHFLNHAVNTSEYDDMDWNFYEIVDGKKETILDYLDMVMADEDLALDYDIPELKSMMLTLEEAGAKRGRELKD